MFNQYFLGGGGVAYRGAMRDCMHSRAIQNWYEQTWPFLKPSLLHKNTFGAVSIKKADQLEGWKGYWGDSSLLLENTVPTDRKQIVSTRILVISLTFSHRYNFFENWGTCLGFKRFTIQIFGNLSRSRCHSNNYLNY